MMVRPSMPAPHVAVPPWPAELATPFRKAHAIVILPTLNEEGGLRHTLDGLQLPVLRSSARRVETLVVDGGSTDRTLEVAAAAGVPSVRQTTRGKGAAVREAVAWANAQGIPYAIVLDADATYPPDRVLDALELLEQGIDLVVGVRRPVHGPPISFREASHRLGNIGLSFTASWLAHRTIFDLCSGFWGVATGRFVGLDLERSHFAIEAELVLKSISSGFRVVQIPVEYRERVGEAKLRAVRDGSRILLTILRHGRAAPAHLNGSDLPEPGLSVLLSIGLITGSHSAVLQCGPFDSPTARDVAAELRRTFPQTEVEVGSDAATPAPEPTRDLEDPGRMVISLRPGVDLTSDARSMAVSVGSVERRLTVEVPIRIASAPDSGPENRSGGWLAPPPAPGSARFPSLEVLTSRLSYDRVHLQRSMLSANGFDVRERPPPRRSPVEPQPGDP